MKRLLQFIVFVLMFFVSLMLSSVILYWIFSITGINFEKYGWTGVFGAFIAIYFIYRNQDLSNLFSSKMIWLSIAGVVLLTLIIPNGSPAYHHTDIFIYSYGFPLKFLTLYLQDGANYLIPNLFSTNIKDWSLTGGFLFNFIFFYLVLYVLWICIESRDNDLNE